MVPSFARRVIARKPAWGQQAFRTKTAASLQRTVCLDWGPGGGALIDQWLMRTGQHQQRRGRLAWNGHDKHAGGGRALRGLARSYQSYTFDRSINNKQAKPSSSPRPTHTHTNPCTAFLHRLRGSQDRMATKKWTTARADGEVDIRMEPEGPGSWPAMTVFQAFEETVKKYGDRPALHFKKVPRVS